MRLIVIKQVSDLSTLSRTLFSDGTDSSGDAAAQDATLDRIKALNPQVDFQRMEIGTVLLLPDVPELSNSETQSIAGDAFADFSSHLIEGLGTAAQRLSGDAKALDAEREVVTDALTTAAVDRLIRSDPLLAKQLDEANEAFSNEQKAIQVAARQVRTMQSALADELAALAKLLG